MNRSFKLFNIFSAIILIAVSELSAQQFQKNSYEVVEGKMVGIWPHNDRFKSPDRLKELKDRWGFNYLLVAAIYGNEEKSVAAQAGFDSMHIIYQIYLPDFIKNKELELKKIREIGKIWAYYFDEPISRSHSYLQFLKLISFLSEEELYPHAKFIVSELDENKAATVLPFVDLITYSGYGDNENLGIDQVKTWGEWKSFIGEKFGMPWISAQLDSNEYRSLFKAARDFKFDSIMFYELEPLPSGHEVSDANFEKFCEAAVEFGFMKIRKKNAN
ncbi:MAG: hypothetical protein NTX65_17465 [Ignavibacteriales bacterium]|nr:hypothetical protein [Ignavibacteriales bacterium]